MFLRYNLFGIIWALIILLLTTSPGFAMPKTVSWDLLNFDAFAHFFVFCVFAFLIIVGFLKQYRFPKLKSQAIKYALLISAIYGILIEIVQGFIPGRSTEFTDIIADISGSFGGWGLFYLVYKL